MGQILVYIAVGLATFGTYAAAVVLFSATTDLLPGFVTMISYSIAAATNFIGHLLFTFQTTRSLRSTLPRYVLLLACNSLVGGLIVQFGVSFLELSIPVANAVMLSAVTVSTFFLMKWWVMSDVRHS